jgi:hypothetical protein
MALSYSSLMLPRRMMPPRLSISDGVNLIVFQARQDIEVRDDIAIGVG